jgi:pantothenate kinase
MTRCHVSHKLPLVSLLLGCMQVIHGDSDDLSHLKPADMAMSLLRMISYNIGQLAYLNAKRWGWQAEANP